MASSAAGDGILGAIPHRAPFLFVDRIVERSEREIVTEWDVDPGADFLRGHYPGSPIVPGVLLCESAFQAGALLCALVAGERAPAGSAPVLARIGEARFRRRVLPGETVRCRVALEEEAGFARRFAAHVTSGGETVLQVSFTVALAEGG